MKLKVLGSGSSGNCYLLQGKKETLILECGLPYKTILKGLNFKIGNVVGCLISHEHKDHCKAVNDLIKNGIEIGASIGTLREIGTSKLRTYNLNILKSELQTYMGGFDILPFKTEHDAAEPLGFLIQHKEMGKLLFITDSYYCQYKFEDVDHVLIECNYSNEILEQKDIPMSLKKRIVKSHFELENVKNFLGATDLKNTEEIILIHLSDGNSNSEQFKAEIEGLTGKPVYVADKGLELELEGYHG